MAVCFAQRLTSDQTMEQFGWTTCRERHKVNALHAKLGCRRRDLLPQLVALHERTVPSKLEAAVAALLVAAGIKLQHRLSTRRNCYRR